MQISIKGGVFGADQKHTLEFMIMQTKKTAFSLAKMGEKAVFQVEIHADCIFIICVFFRRALGTRSIEYTESTATQIGVRFKRRFLCDTAPNRLVILYITAPLWFVLRKNRLLKSQTPSEQKFDDFCGLCTQSSITLQGQRPHKARISAALGGFRFGPLLTPKITPSASKQAAPFGGLAFFEKSCYNIKLLSENNKF